MRCRFLDVLLDIIEIFFRTFILFHHKKNFKDYSSVIGFHPVHFLFGLYVNASPLFLPHTDHVEGALQSNSFMKPLPHRVLEAAWFVVPLPTHGTTHFRQLLFVILICTHEPQLHSEVTCNSEVFGTASATLTKHLSDAGETTSYIPKLLLESGTYTAITSVVPNRLALHLSSNFHDLGMCKTVLELAMLRNHPYYHNTHIQGLPGSVHSSHLSCRKMSLNLEARAGGLA